MPDSPALPTYSTVAEIDALPEGTAIRATVNGDVIATALRIGRAHDSWCVTGYLYGQRPAELLDLHSEWQALTPPPPIPPVVVERLVRIEVPAASVAEHLVDGEDTTPQGLLADLVDDHLLEAVMTRLALPAGAVVTTSRWPTGDLAAAAKALEDGHDNRHTTWTDDARAVIAAYHGVPAEVDS